ncbi:MAG: restriction endonuclease [Acidimicrobiia bacterium]
MPQRTNLQQAVIYYVKRHYAPPDVEVTESKMLRDSESNEDREVDVVMEGMVGDERLTISIEVKADRRRAGTPWIDSMIGKHQRMPTSKLVLVSWSGFSRPAQVKMERQGGRVVGLTPEAVTGLTVPPLFYEELGKTPEKAVVLVSDDAGTRAIPVDAPILLNIYAAPSHDAYLCTLRDMVVRILNERGGGEELSRQAHEHPERDDLTHFSIEMTELDHLGLYVHNTASDAFRTLCGFRVTGPITLRREQIDFRVMRLGESVFAMSELQMAGKDAVWVLTPNEDKKSATVSWRLI